MASRTSARLPRSLGYSQIVNDERMRALDMLDAQEGTGPVPLLTGDDPARLLARSRRIAVVGASPSPLRPSNGVMQFLLDQGFDVVPINPRCDEVLGQRSFATLEEATRRPADLTSSMSSAARSTRRR